MRRAGLADEIRPAEPDWDTFAPHSRFPAWKVGAARVRDLLLRR